MISVNGFGGFYVVLDGIVGCGKSEQIKQLQRYLPLDFPGIKVVFTHEPGGTPEADKIREILLNNILTPEEEVKLFRESRRITLNQIVRPALRRGELVVSDRSVTTSIAYQGEGREYGPENVWEKNKEVVGGTFPDCLVLLNSKLEVCLQRSGSKNPDKFDKENIGFWIRVLRGYSTMTKLLKEISPNTEIIVINDPQGDLTIEQTRLEVKRSLYPLVRRWSKEGGIYRERQV